MDRIIFHIDVNSAYLSWSALEKLQNGSDVDLRAIPAIVGGDMAKRHGVVLAKSIPAKAYGITTGEPIVSALRKCPGLFIEPPDHSLYSRRSRELMTLLADICPDIEQVSVDECYMDYSAIQMLYPSPEAAAHIIKDRVREQLHFTVNVGISDRKVLAKMASDFRKPDLVHTLYSYEIQDKMWPLPVSALFMCGHSSVEALRKLEILTIGDLARADRSVLEAHLKSHGTLLWEYANGIDDAEVATVQADAKGIGNSTTLSRDAEDRETAHLVLLSLAESVARRLRAAGQCCLMVSVEIKYNTFRKASHQTTLFSPTSQTDLLYRTACALFDELWDGTPVRLLGLRSSKLTAVGEPVQMSLFDYQADLQPASPQNHSPAGKASADAAPVVTPAPAVPAREKREKLDAALDAIRKRYGENAVVRGSLMRQSGGEKKSEKNLRPPKL